MVFTQMECHPAMKKKGIPAICRNMSQTEGHYAK